jgi:hypothetical protein
MSSGRLLADSVKRPFAWGVVIVGDPLADVPQHSGDNRFMTSAQVIVVPVRPAQDVEDLDDPPFEVEINVCERGSGFSGAAHHSLLRLSSGEMTIGDADGELRLNLGGPGWWWVSITLHPSGTSRVRRDRAQSRYDLPGV